MWANYGEVMAEGNRVVAQWTHTDEQHLLPHIQALGDWSDFCLANNFYVWLVDTYMVHNKRTRKVWSYAGGLGENCVRDPGNWIWAVVMQVAMGQFPVDDTTICYLNDESLGDILEAITAFGRGLYGYAPGWAHWIPQIERVVFSAEVLYYHYTQYQHLRPVDFADIMDELRVANFRRYRVINVHIDLSEMD